MVQRVLLGIDRVLSDPWVSRASNASFLAGAVVFVVRFISGYGVLTAVAVLLLAIGLIGHAARYARRRSLAAFTPVPPGLASFPRTKLERAVIESLIAAEDMERERPVRGDRWFSEALPGWAGDTAKRLEDEGAGALLEAFADDGIEAPHGTQEELAYLRRSVELLRDALKRLRG